MPTNILHVPSRAVLRKKLGGKSPLYEFLDYYAFRSTKFKYFDFLGDTIDLDYWAVANSGGTGVANFAAAVIDGGAIRGNTGTTDNGSQSLVGPIIYSGDRNCGMWARVKFDVVTGQNWEIGFIDAVPGSNGPGVSDIDTPAFTAADSAVLHRDTDQTLTTMAFATNGSTAGQPDQATTLTGITVPTAAVYMDVIVQLEGNNAYCFVGDTTSGYTTVSHNTDTDGHVEGGVLLAPWVYVRTRSTTAIVTDISAMAVWNDQP